MRKKTILEIGKTYNLLTIIEEAEHYKDRPAYKCKCACGKEIIMQAKRIATNKTKSCGCLRSYVGSAHMGYPYKDYIGKRFDRLTVLEYDYSRIGRGSWLLCQCDCGNKKVISANKLTTKMVKSCGCRLEEIKRSFKKKEKNVSER